MASLKFEGELQEISDKQIQFMRDILGKRGFIDNKVLFTSVGEVGDNYAANMKRITVEVENGDNFYMIAKIAAHEEGLRAMTMTEKIFSNEVIMYTEILPKFVSLQKTAGVFEDNILRYAKCYGFLTEQPHELILLEDLSVLNFGMLNRLEPLPNDAIKFILKYFSNLHALSFALKTLEPVTYNQLKDKVVNLWSLAYEVPDSEKMWVQLEKDIIELLDNEDYKTAIQGTITGSIPLNISAINYDKDSMSSVILHGDGWTNNAMFQIQNGVRKECIMIDYQISREGNPACDILYMIFTCTDYKTRAEHFYKWLDYYHEELDKSLNNFGMKATVIYPKHLLQADVKRYSKIYFSIAIFILNVVLRKSNEAAEISKAMCDDIDKMADSRATSTLSAETVSLYKTRVKELIDSCRDFGLM